MCKATVVAVSLALGTISAGADDRVALLEFELGMSRSTAMARASALASGEYAMSRRDVHVFDPSNDLPHETFLTAVTLSEETAGTSDRVTVGFLPGTNESSVYLLTREVEYARESSQDLAHVLGALQSAYGEPTERLDRDGGLEKRWVSGASRQCPNECRVVVPHPHFGHAIYDPHHLVGYVAVATYVDRVVTAVIDVDGENVRRIRIEAIDLRLRADVAAADLSARVATD